MTGFSADWLALREPWDHAARAPDILTRLRRWAAGRTAPVRRAVDLGCGTGSTTRYLDPHLPGAPSWTLVDGDPDLLARAEGARITTALADLATTDLGELLCGADLVTASALLDLVSRSWLERFWRAARANQTAVLAGLTYDGRFALSPSDPLDAVIRDRVNRHQHGEKGFGPALGPTATSKLIRQAREAGWTCLVKSSDWRLDARADMAGMKVLLEGWATAASEIDPGGDAVFRAWLDRRLDEPGLKVVVGHLDLLALPPNRNRTRRPFPDDASGSLDESRRRPS